MGFELESDSGLRFTSRRQSPTVPTSCHTGPNTFLVIGTDPPPSRRRVAVSAPPQLETLPVGKLIPITVGTLDNLTNSTNNRQSSGRPLPSKTRTFHVSHSASETLRRRTWNTNSAVRRRADSYHHSLTNDSTPVEMNLLKPPPLDLRSEQLTLSPEEMADVKYRNRHLLRLHSANHVILLKFLYLLINVCASKVSMFN